MNNYTHLTMQDRCLFNVFLEMGLAISEIAYRMNRHRSTLHRELKRNQDKSVYKPGLANQKALARRQRKSFIQLFPTLRQYVVQHLKLGWSPEQICGRLKRKKSKYIICHETIYRFIYKHCLSLHRYLPYKKPRRFRPRARKPQQCRFGERRIISERASYIDERKHYGHWEGDSIEFEGNKKAHVTTLVERKTRFLCLIKNETKISATVMGNIYKKLSSLSQKVCKSITFDQGTEFSSFVSLESPLSCKVFYCHAHSPWEKGTNENMNGRLRWVIPKNANIDKLRQEQLDELANRMNNTPRKCLDYKTPNELFLTRFTDCCRTSL